MFLVPQVSVNFGISPSSKFYTHFMIIFELTLKRKCVKRCK